MKKIGFKEKYLIFLVMIGFLVIGLYYSYAIFVTKQLQENVVSIRTNESSIKLDIDGQDKVTIKASSEKKINIHLQNKGNVKYYYEIFFQKNNSNIMVYSSSPLIKNEIDTNEEKVIEVNIINNNNQDEEIKFIVGTSTTNIVVKDIGYSYINQSKNYDHTKANKPYIGNLKLIPVSYHKISDKEGYWYKTDVNNQDDVWYDYDAGRWANAVFVNESDYQKYQKMSLQSEILMEDILGFYVWIPRFKYTVLNNSNYTSFERINSIYFEEENASTGTISCYDNISNMEDTHLYSEVCEDNYYGRIYDNLSTYTHPAFQNNNGFWVAKFLMSDGEKSLPNALMLKKNIMDISNITFKNNAHLLTNMEYGAITILSNSSYGKSGNKNYFTDDNYTFKRIYNNSYLYDLTGCSSEYNNFSKSFISTTSKVCVPYNDLTNYSHIANGVKYNVYEVGSGASTTGTIYGIYDMANINGELTSGIIALENGDIPVNLQYRDIYSYNNYLGIIKSSSTAVNLYRYKLGDAIKENFRTLSINGMWQGGMLEHKSNSGIIIRGGNKDIKNSSIYTASIVDYQEIAPFRLVITK